MDPWRTKNPDCLDDWKFIKWPRAAKSGPVAQSHRDSGGKIRRIKNPDVQCHDKSIFGWWNFGRLATDKFTPQQFFFKKRPKKCVSGIKRNVQHWQMARTPMAWQSSNKSNQWGTFDFCSSFYRSFETCMIKKQRWKSDKNCPRWQIVGDFLQVGLLGIWGLRELCPSNNKLNRVYDYLQKSESSAVISWCFSASQSHFFGWKTIRFIVPRISFQKLFYESTKTANQEFTLFSPTAQSSLNCMKPEFFEVPNKNMCLWIVDTTCSMFLRYRKNIIGVLQLQVVVNHACLGGFDVPGRYSSDSDDDWDFMIVFWLRCLRGFYDHLLLLTRNHHHTFFGKTKKNAPWHGITICTNKGGEIKLNDWYPGSKGELSTVGSLKSRKFSNPPSWDRCSPLKNGESYI